MSSVWRDLILALVSRAAHRWRWRFVYVLNRWLSSRTLWFASSCLFSYFPSHNYVNLGKWCIRARLTCVLSPEMLIDEEKYVSLCGKWPLKWGGLWPPHHIPLQNLAASASSCDVAAPNNLRFFFSPEPFSEEFASTSSCYWQYLYWKSTSGNRARFAMASVIEICLLCLLTCLFVYAWYAALLWI